MSISTLSLQIETEAKLVAVKFVNEYGVVTRFIAAHPKTAVIITALVAGVIGHLI